MKSAAPVKTYQHRSKPYSVHPRTANVFNRGFDTVARRERVSNISALQESVAKMEEYCNEIAVAARALRVPEKRGGLCGFCHRFPTDPFILECGDVFCFPCIAGSVDDIHERFDQQSPRSRSIPPHLLQALRRPLANLEKYFEAVRYCKENPGPEYTCPACNRFLKYRPVKVFDEEALKQTFKIRSTPEEHEVVQGNGSNGSLFVDCPLL